MTDRKLNNLARAGAFAFLVLFFILVAIGAAFGQEASQTSQNVSVRHSHSDDSFIRFALLRLLPPAELTNVEPNEFGTRIEYVITDRRQIKNGSFQIAKGTEKVGEIKKGRKYWLLYCSADDFLVTIVPVADKQFK